MEEDINKTDIDAYEKERDELLKKHSGKYVAYSNGHRILIKVDEDILYREARKLVPHGVIMINKIIPRDQEPAYELRTPSFGKLENTAQGGEGR